VAFQTQGAELLTFAISLQLLPASRIAFNLCSSAAVHGVFVRPFLAGGGWMGCTLSATFVFMPASPEYATVEPALAGAIDVGASSPEGLRFLGFADGCS